MRARSSAILDARAPEHVNAESTCEFNHIEYPRPLAGWVVRFPTKGRKVIYLACTLHADRVRRIAGSTPIEVTPFERQNESAA